MYLLEFERVEYAHSSKNGESPKSPDTLDHDEVVKKGTYVTHCVVKDPPEEELDVTRVVELFHARRRLQADLESQEISDLLLSVT